MKNDLPSSLFLFGLLILLPILSRTAEEANDGANRLRAIIKDGRIEANISLCPGESIYVGCKSDAPELNRCILAATLPADAPFTVCEAEISLFLNGTELDSRLVAGYAFKSPERRVQFVSVVSRRWEQPVQANEQPVQANQQPFIKFEPILLKGETADAHRHNFAEAKITFKDQSVERVTLEVWITKDTRLYRA